MNGQRASAAGRVCPADYRYPAAALRRALEVRSETLYVVGGLYGNRPALDVVEAMAQSERAETTVVFNGDFHWFDATPERFADISGRVVRHLALRGNVETELGRAHDIGAGCGCTYPDAVDQGTVDRSNLILGRLRDCLEDLPGMRDVLAALPMTLLATVGSLRVGVVHGDAESLAGWRFAHDALDASGARAWLEGVRVASGVDVFASSHTCLPVLRDVALEAGRLTIANNGAAGMPSFRDTCHGILTRISIHPSPHPAIHGVERDGVFIEALPIPYDQRRWLREFVAIWPPGSPAYESYFRRMVDGPQYTRSEFLAASGEVATVARRERAA
ncbi:MAG: metallophosphoesterase family protein [Casimicrobiaceae bacterium]